MFENYGSYMSTRDCCDALMVGKNTIYKLIREGELSGSRIGVRLWRVSKESLINYIKKQSGIT